MADLTRVPEIQLESTKRFVHAAKMANDEDYHRCHELRAIVFESGSTVEQRAVAFNELMERYNRRSSTMFAVSNEVNNG